MTIEAQNLLSNVYRWSAYVGACSDIAGESSNRRGGLLSPAANSSILPRGDDLIVSPRIYTVKDPNSSQYGSGRTKGSARPRTDISHQIAGAHGEGEEEADGDIRMREEWERRGGNVRRQDGCSAPCNETVFSVCSSAGYCTCGGGSEDVGGGSCVSTSNLYIEQIRVNGLNLIFRCLLHLLDNGPGVSNQFRSDGEDSRFGPLFRVSGLGFWVSSLSVARYLGVVYFRIESIGKKSVTVVLWISRISGGLNKSTTTMDFLTSHRPTPHCPDQPFSQDLVGHEIAGSAR